MPGHTAILFHAGNTEASTIACVILGQYAGILRKDRAVMNRGHTFRAFMEYMKDEDKAVLEINHYY